MPDKKIERISWKAYALKLAMVASERSEDTFMKVGACLLRHDNSVASLGYNGAPPGIGINWHDRDDRRSRVVHAEVNALRYVKPDECYLLACSHMPCNDCIKTIAAYGIKEIVYNEVYVRDMSSLYIAPDFGIKLFCTEKAAGQCSFDDRDKYEVINDI
jgi:dCMP deaminase